MNKFQQRMAGVLLAIFWESPFAKSLEDLADRVIEVFESNKDNWDDVEKSMLTLLDIWPSKYTKIDWAAFRRDLNLILRVYKNGRD